MTLSVYEDLYSCSIRNDNKITIFNFGMNNEMFQMLYFYSYDTFTR